MSLTAPQTPQPAPERTLPARVFLSPDEPRLRAGWRILLHAIGFNFIIICLTLTALIPIVLFGSSPENLWPNQIIAVLAVTPTVFLARRFLDRRSIVSLGLQINLRTIYDLLAGIVITFLMMGLIYFIERAAGWLTFEGFAWETVSVVETAFSSLGAFLLFILVGWHEELLYRGYRLQNISEGLNPTWGVVISSLWFGAGHILNPHATLFSTAGIFLAGLFLAYPYLRTRQLWLSIGLHIGWNFFEGVVFGFPVSGLDIYRLTRVQVHGPELWTGGAFGPEAGLVLIPALVLGTGLIYLYTRFRNLPS